MATDTGSYERWIAIAQASASAGCGDCVRVLSLEGGRILFFIADVAGHDERASRVARQVDAHLSNIADVGRPGALLTSLNARVARSLPVDLFVCAVSFLLDPVTGRGSIAAAGQLPPVLKSSSSCRPIHVQGGPPLGLLAQASYSDHAFQLEGDDLLVAVTDGVTDPLATDGDLLGLAALAQLVDRAPPDPSEACAALLRAARRAGLRDDATVLAIAPAFQGAACPALANGRVRLAA